MGRIASVTPAYVPGEFGPNDHHYDAATQTMKPGLGSDHRPRKNGQTALADPPDKAKLRAQAAALSQVERDLASAKQALEEREAKIAEREAELASQLANLKDLAKK